MIINFDTLNAFMKFLKYIIKTFIIFNVIPVKIFCILWIKFKESIFFFFACALTSLVS